VKWKSKVTPVIIGAIKMISKSFRKYLSNTPGMHEIKEPKKEPYWTLHTYFRKYYCKSTKYLTQEIKLHVP